LKNETRPALTQKVITPDLAAQIAQRSEEAKKGGKNEKKDDVLNAATLAEVVGAVEAVDTKAVALLGAIEAVEAKVDDIHDSASSDFAAVRERMEKSQKKAKEAAERLTNNQSAIVKNGNDVLRLQENLAACMRGNATNAEQIAAHSKLLGSLQNAVGEPAGIKLGRELTALRKADAKAYRAICGEMRKHLNMGRLPGADWIQRILESDPVVYLKGAGILAAIGFGIWKGVRWVMD
jgi:chromosome segregation ATPase